MVDLNKYLAKGENWEKLCDRVSGIMMYRDQREELYQLLVDKKFTFNSPAWVNGHRGGGRSMMACNLLQVGNSTDEITGSVAQAAAIFKGGGGVGLDFNDLSPAGTRLAYTTQGIASGPVSFMGIHNAAAEAIKEGGLRRAAMMGTLSVTHPDAGLFIRAKDQDGQLENFNLSLTYPEGPDSAPAGLFEEHCKHAWQKGEPSIIYLDIANRDNPVKDHPDFGETRSANACAELNLFPYEPCVLGHIVLPNVIQKLGDYTELRRVCRAGVRALDRVIDINSYGLSEIAQMARALRRIGLGVCGWDTLLKREGIPFNSINALQLAREIGRARFFAADSESWKLANEFGGYLPDRRRNVTLTVVAPTGHVAELAGVSKSIYLDSYAEQLGMTVDEHLNHVAAWQQWTDNAISYTVCFPNDAPVGIVEEIFRKAYGLEIKAIAVYRDGSRPNQPCTVDGCEL